MKPCERYCHGEWMGHRAGGFFRRWGKPYSQSGGCRYYTHDEERRYGYDGEHLCEHPSAPHPDRVITAESGRIRYLKAPRWCPLGSDLPSADIKEEMAKDLRELLQTWTIAPYGLLFMRGMPSELKVTSVGNAYDRLPLEERGMPWDRHKVLRWDWRCKARFYRRSRWWWWTEGRWRGWQIYARLFGRRRPGIVLRGFFYDMGVRYWNWRDSVEGPYPIYHEKKWYYLEAPNPAKDKILAHGKGCGKVFAYKAWRFDARKFLGWKDRMRDSGKNLYTVPHLGKTLSRLDYYEQVLRNPCPHCGGNIVETECVR